MREGGSGLGLAIAKKHVDLMNGQLNVETQLGKGTKFFFSIPLPHVEKALPKPVEEVTKDLIVSRLVSGYKVKALVVDDNIYNRDILSQVLKEINVEVSEAENGQIALDKVLEEDYDIVFMDMRMPVMRGEEAVEKIQEKLGKNKPKIVAITASVFLHERDGFLALGCHSFISKPFQMHEVYQSLKDLLGVEYEFQEGDVAKIGNVTEPDFLELSKIRIPEDLRIRLKEEVELYKVTEVENILQEISKIGEDGRLLVDYLHIFLKNYDMEGIWDVLRKINHV